MVTVVLPAMAKELRAFDEVLFPEPSCATCHGEDGAARAWAMPNPKLARLSPDGRFDVEMRHSPDFTMFMVKTMQPRMRELLGDETLDCFRCHLPRDR